MGIYIKGMKMPTNCCDCPMCYDMMECTVAEPIINFFKEEELEKFDFVTERHPRCPLVSVGPHGRLIDADAFLALVNDRTILSDFLKCIISPLIRGEPTVIEAEEGENGGKQ